MVRKVQMRVGVLGVGLALAVGGLGTAAAATDGLISTIRAQDKILNSAPGDSALKHLGGTKARAKAQIPELTAFATMIRHAATAVSQAQTTSATQKTAQGYWVQGARQLATAVDQVTDGLKDYEQGHKAAARLALAKGLKELAAADKVGDRADKLLGLPKND